MKRNTDTPTNMSGMLGRVADVNTLLGLQAVPVFASASTASHVVGNVMKKLWTLVILRTFITRGVTPVKTRQRPVFWCET